MSQGGATGFLTVESSTAYVQQRRKLSIVGKAMESREDKTREMAQSNERRDSSGACVYGLEKMVFTSW